MFREDSDACPLSVQTTTGALERRELAYLDSVRIFAKQETFVNGHNFKCVLYAHSKMIINRQTLIIHHQQKTSHT